MSALTNPKVAPAQAPPQPRTPAPHGPEPSGGRKWVWLAAAGLGVAGLIAWQVSARREAASTASPIALVKTVKAVAGPLHRTVRLNGQTSSLQFANVVAPITRGRESGQEMVLMYLVPSGTKVKAGQKLAQIDAQAAIDHIEDVADDIERAQADIVKRQAEHWVETEGLEHTMRSAEANWTKAKLDLKASETRTVIDQELLKLAVDEAEAQYNQAKADVAAKKSGQAAEIRILEITKIRHDRHKGRHEFDLKKYTMYSPMDGLAVTQQVFRGTEFGVVQQGDQLRPGQLFMKVVNPEKMQVEATINQSEADDFRIGQKASILLDAYPGIRLPGKIFSVGALAVGSRYANDYGRTIPVKLLIEGSHEKLIPDLSASADVQLASTADAIRIPRGAVQWEGDKPFVYVKQGTSFVKREVELGMRSAIEVDVKSGVNAGEEVALERPPAVQKQS